MTLDALLADWRAADERARYWERELRILVEEDMSGTAPDAVHATQVQQMRVREQQALYLVLGVIDRYLPRGWSRALDALHVQEFEDTVPA